MQTLGLTEQAAAACPPTPTLSQPTPGQGSKQPFCEAKLSVEPARLGKQPSLVTCPELGCGVWGRGSGPADRPGGSERWTLFLAGLSGFLRPLGHAGGQGFS